MKKKLAAILIAVLACVFAFAACSSDTTATDTASDSAAPAASESAAADTSASDDTASTDTAAADDTASSDDTTAAAADGDLSVELVAKGFQHQFWQVVKEGSEAAGTDLGASINFVGPPSESDIQEQVNELNSALSKNPSAICLAALDTGAVTSQLADAEAAGIPVIGFDSGVPDAPAGQVKATAATDNRAAAALAADEMMKDEEFAAKVKAATADNPVVVAVLSQDATSASVTQRTEGFIQGFKANCEEFFPNAVEVTGHDLYNMASDEDPAVIISVHIAPTTDANDLKNIGTAALNEDGIIGIFCSNEGTVTGLLNATSDGADLDKENGQYKDLTVAGFDAGKTQKAAVKNGWFLGSVTQDPYQIGYKAVELAVAAAKGESVEDTDTGAQWYTAANMDEPDIAKLLYD